MTKRQDRVSRIRQRLNQIPGQMAWEVQRMARVRQMARGYVYHSRRRCGKASCRCARGELHEAWVVATRVGGQRTTRSLGGGRRGAVQPLAENYRQFRQALRAMGKLCKEVRALARELQALISEDLFEQEDKP